MDGVELVNTLNAIGAKNGVGINDLVENRLVGMKSRGVYETHADPSSSTHTPNSKDSALTALPSTSRKSQLSNTANSYTTACGLHRSVKHCRHLPNKTSETVTGTVKLRLYKGNIMSAGATSPYSSTTKNS